MNVYATLQRRTTSFDTTNIVCENEGLFKIRSGVNFYEVNANIGTCSCKAGVSGAFCKHQCFLMDQKKIKFPNAPPISQEDRHQLALLACGSKCPDISFFEEFDHSRNKLEEEKNEPASKELQAQLKGELYRLASLVSDELENNSVTRLISSLKKVKTARELQSTFIVKAKPPTGRTKRIKVQPTSISRRKSASRSSRRLLAGARPLSAGKRLKRKRQLSKNIAKNIQNAKSHGTAH
nr:uncharacterized protein LOC122272702 [Parasteatoda tepidariorum]